MFVIHGLFSSKLHARPISFFLQWMGCVFIRLQMYLEADDLQQPAVEEETASRIRRNSPVGKGMSFSYFHFP